MQPETLENYPDWPAPKGGRVHMVACSDGLSLRAAHWPQARGGAGNGTLIVLQGRGECIEKYYDVVREAQARGLNVVTFDWRGQGRSRSPIREMGRLRRFFLRHRPGASRLSRYLKDFDQVFSDVVLPNAPPPYYLLAHSTGALIAMHAARRHPRRFERMVLTSPLVRFAESGWLDILFMHAVARTASLLFLGGLRWDGYEGYDRRTFNEADNPWSHDTAWVERLKNIYESSPDLLPDRPTLGWLAVVTSGMLSLSQQKAIDTLNTQCLAISSGGDAYVSVKAAQIFYSRLRPALGQWVCLPIARHDLLMETAYVRKVVWSAFDAFVPGHLPTPYWGEPVV